MKTPRDLRFTRGLASQGVAQLAQFGVTLALMPLVIKMAGAGTYGSYLVLTSIITLVSTFLSLGAGFECRRGLPRAADRESRAAMFLPSMSIQFISFGLSALLLVLVLPWLNEHVFHGGFRLHSLTIVVAVYSIYANNLADDYFRYSHQIPLISKAVVIRAIAYPLIILGAALLGWPPQTERLILLQALTSLAVSAGLWWRISREIPLAFRFQSWAGHSADIRVGFPLIAAVLVENLLSTTDRYVLAMYLSPFDVGAYAAAFSLGSLVLLVPRVASLVLPPALAEAVDGGRKNEAERRLRGFIQAFAMLALPFMVGAALLGGQVLRWLADAAVAERAFRVVPIIAVASALYGYCYLVFNALFVSRETKAWLTANVAAVVVSIGLNLLLVWWLRSIEAAALATLASYIVRFLIVWKASRSWKLSVNWPLMAKSAVAAAGMAVILYMGCALPYGGNHLTVRLFILTASGIATYFAILAWIGGFTPHRLRSALGI